ncbi:MAG: galactokinase [Candidatus Hydrogenedentota bacterium]
MEQLASEFFKRFAARPLLLARAPGRVNLIGEHVDYNGLPVLPMTLDREIRIAGRPRPDKTIRIHNTNPKFAPAEFFNAESIEPSSQGAWENYCKAAVVGVNRKYGLGAGSGMELLVDATLPPAAGLSSSSALVVATSLAYLGLRGVDAENETARIELATLLAEAERYVGTEGGGMDQAIILLGDADCACKIDFFPLRIERVPLPVGYTFVVCDSRVKADKSGDARHRYNQGPALSRLICAMAERQAQLTYGAEIEVTHLGDFWFGPLCLTHSEIEALFIEAFPRPRTRLSEAARFLEMNEDEIRRRWIGDLPEPLEGFPLQARARHQLSEFQRVEQARDCLLAGDAAGFGALMDASHRSCAEDFGVSCAELDELVEAARQSGSIGSRLTGAGFGGCTVHLVPDEKLGQFRDGVISAYYAPKSIPVTVSEGPIIEGRAGRHASFLHL